MRRAILFEEPTVDYLAVHQHVKHVVFLFSDTQARPSILDNSIVPAITDALERINFDPKSDYLVVTGELLPVVLMIGAASYKHNFINLLVFSVPDRNYLPMRLELDEAVG